MWLVHHAYALIPCPSCRFYFKSGWGGTDPACIQFMVGEMDFTKTLLGSASSVYALNLPGLAITQNVSILKINCSFVGQFVAEEDTKENGRRERTLVVRVHTPGTTGDNFGLFVRDRNAKINPSIDNAPAKAWFEFAKPSLSNAFSAGGECLRGMCDGKYGISVPAIAGSMYEARVPLGWYVFF